MKKPVVLIVCNALDDATRTERGIGSDSPAASRKVFMLCQALRTAGARPYVLSLGRGSTNGTLKYYGRKAKRVNGISVIYSSFSHVRFFSQVLSLFSLVGMLFRLSKSPSRSIVFYNRMSAYLPLLFTSVFTGYRRFLDLEDGENFNAKQAVIKVRWNRFLAWVYDRYCSNGALLACSALASRTAIRPIHCYYGSVSTPKVKYNSWLEPERHILMGGTLSADTGVNLLIDTVRMLRGSEELWVKKLSFQVTGKGEGLDALKQLALEDGFPKVTVHGRTTNLEYIEILERCCAGLALKPIGGEMADTTFPSKVIEFAEAGLLVISTDISDVRKVLGEGALYLGSNDPKELADILKLVVDDTDLGRSCAEKGSLIVLERCSPLSAGQAVLDFITGEIS